MRQSRERGTREQITTQPLVLRSAPAAAPQAVRWPAAERAPIVLSQPPLPWEPLPGDSAGNGPGQGGAADGAAVVRTRRFGDSWAGPLPRRLPDPEAWCVRLATALLEALQGIRPVSQLARWLDPAAMAHLTLQARRRNPGQERPGLHAVHLTRTGPTVVEAVAVYGGPERRAAMAFRLQAHGDRWLCTALELQPRGSRGGPATVSRRG